MLIVVRHIIIRQQTGGGMAVSETEQGAFAWGTGTEAVGPHAAPRRRAVASAERAEVTPHKPAPDEPLPPDNELWDVRAAARFLKRSVSWVYHRAEDGTLPVKRLAGWGVRFVPSELRAWVGEATRPGRR